MNWEKNKEIIDIISKSNNKTDVLGKLELKNNGGNYKSLEIFIKTNNVDVSHFNEKSSNSKKKDKGV